MSAGVAIKSFHDFLELRIYDELFLDDSSIINRFFRMFMSPAVPLIGVLMYWFLSKPLCSFLMDFFKVKPKGIILNSITIFHSAILAIYSMITFFNAARIVAPYIAVHGLYPSLCDSHGEVWQSTDNSLINGLGFWITHFYISKYYEFIDTWVVLLKGREPIFLQTYHHAGIVILMWGVVVTKNTSAGGMILCLNSFIHSLMYTYYTLSACGINIPFKHLVTQAQIVQFLVGVFLTIPTYACLNEAQTIVMAAIHIYTLVLISLFGQFYSKSYSRSNSSSDINNRNHVKKSL